MATNFNLSLTVNKSHFQSRSKLSSQYGTIGRLQQSSWYDASVTTAKASTPVAINAIATMLESINQALLLTKSDDIGPDSGDRELTIAVLGKTVSYRPTAKIILPIAIITIAVMLENISRMSLSNSGNNYGV